MALCNDGHGSARRHRDLNGCGERFEFPRRSRPPGTPGGCVTELLLGLKTPLVEKGPVPRRPTPAANGIGVAAPALAGMPDRIKVEPVTGSCQSRPCHGRLMPKRRHLIVVGSRSPIVPGSPLRTLLTRRGPIKVGVWRGGVRPGIAVPAPFVWRRLSGAAVASVSTTPLIEPDMQISRIRLSDKTSRLRPRHVVPKPTQAYEPEVPVEVREWIAPAGIVNLSERRAEEGDFSERWDQAVAPLWEISRQVAKACLREARRRSAAADLG